MGTSLTQVKLLIDNVDVRKRFNEMLGEKANQFMSSIVNTVSLSKQLQDCEPRSIISASLVAASFDLPIDSNLGFSAIVPYNCKDGKKAQFQIMAKGFIQLAIRTGQYAGMNYSEVYEDELKEYDPITKEILFHKGFITDGFREKGATDKIVGYFAWLELKSGFRQSLFMTVNEVTNHAKTYSASYRYDLAKNIRASKWSTDFGAMAKKTVIKLLLSKWGILSIDMRKAIEDDQKVFDNSGAGKYLDNETTIDVESTVVNPFENGDNSPVEARSQENDPEPEKEKIVENPPNKPTENKENTSESLTCFACKREITKKVAEYSSKKYGANLCQKCQEFQEGHK